MRGEITILVNYAKMRWHPCCMELEGEHCEIWLPIPWRIHPHVESEVHQALFGTIEEVLKAWLIAHNVVSIDELRKCGEVIDYKVTYNKLE